MDELKGNFILVQIEFDRYVSIPSLCGIQKAES